MTNISFDKLLKKYGPQVDIPALVIAGASLGFLLDGTLLSAMGFFMLTGETWDWSGLLSGFANLALSLLLAVFGWVYWKFVLLKQGPMFPRLLGFGLLPALMALLSAAMTGVEIYSWLNNLGCQHYE